MDSTGEAHSNKHAATAIPGPCSFPKQTTNGQHFAGVKSQQSPLLCLPPERQSEATGPSSVRKEGRPFVP